MTLQQFCKKYSVADDFDLNGIPVKHPETGEKIYLYSNWNAGFFYRKEPGRGDGRLYPCQHAGDLLDLKVHPDAKKEFHR